MVFDRTVRLVTTARLRDPVLLALVEPDLADDLAEIEGATSGRLAVQEHGSDGLDQRELVAGIPHAHFINAAFTYWRPRTPNRFNGPGRGAWYSALDVGTCIAEVSYHMTRELSNVNDFNATIDYTEMFASFAGEFVDLQGVDPKPDCLDPNPEVGYPEGNILAELTRRRGHYGVIYPSVRNAQGTCIVALIPHAVQSVAQGDIIRLKWENAREPTVEAVA